MSSVKLKNGPLKEAIFELNWISPLDQTGFPLDIEFELAQGKFASSINNDFPVHKRVNTAGNNIRLYGHPFHQFWKGEAKWPVIQIGPGILTVNETNVNYRWDPNYRSDIHTALTSLTTSYQQQLRFNKVSLKYIDTVDISREEDILKFISKNLQTNLVNGFAIPGTLKGLNINQLFTVDDSQVSINIQTGINNLNGSNAIIWITSVEKVGIFSAAEVFAWIDKAHERASTLFRQMLNEEFYASFN